MIVREAGPSDFERLSAFYKRSGYRPAICRSDLFILAEEPEGICGALRLCVEEGVLVLRGMRVAPGRQRRGIGKRLLTRAVEAAEGRECFCIPHRRLIGFYAQVGFVEIADAEAPEFLRERRRRYGEEYALDVTLLRLPGRPAAAWLG
jgi:N-acetylglutamate synthase-like GNAT family acetyltransferase